MGDITGRYNHIETGASSPQISVRAWRSPGWRDFARAFPISVGWFFLFVGLAALSKPEDAKMAPIFFILGAILFLSYIPLKKLGMGEYRLGFDLKTDTLWIYRKGKGIVSIEPDAHKIEGFYYTRGDSARFNYLWHINPSMPLIWRKRQWLLTIKRKSSKFPFGVGGSGLALEKEAQEVAEKANLLLKSTIRGEHENR